MELEDPSIRLLDRFGRFLVFSDQAFRGGTSTLEPLFHVAACWDYWLSGLSRAEREEVTELIEEVRHDSQEQFVQELRGELKARYGTSSAAGFFLLQLGSLPEFVGWRSLAPSRIGPVHWANVVAVKEHKGGQPSGLVLPVAVFLRKREAGQPPFKPSPGLDLGAAELARVRDALVSLLGGTGLARLVAQGSVSGWTCGQPWARWLRLVGWLCAALALGVLFVCAPVLRYGLVARVLVWVLPLVAVLLAVLLRRCLLEALCGWRLSRILLQHQICVFCAAIQDGGLIAPAGASHCVSLAVAILAALLAEEPPAPRSWLWGRFAARLAAGLPRWAFTGGLSTGGRITAVEAESLVPKYEACLAHPEVAELVMPVQASRLSSTEKLRVSRRRHLASVVLSVGAIPSFAAKVTSALAALSMGALLLASPEIYNLFHPLSVPKPVLWKCEQPPYPSGETLFAFVAETDAPDAFLVRLACPTQHGLLVPFRRESHAPSQAKAEIELPRVAVPNPSRGGPWVIQVVRPQSFLGRPLKDTVVLQEDFDGLRKASEAERNRVLR